MTDTSIIIHHVCQNKSAFCSGLLERNSLRRTLAACIEKLTYLYFWLLGEYVLTGTLKQNPFQKIRVQKNKGKFFRLSPAITLFLKGNSLTSYPVQSIQQNSSLIGFSKTLRYSDKCEAFLYFHIRSKYFIK